MGRWKSLWEQTVSGKSPFVRIQGYRKSGARQPEPLPVIVAALIIKGIVPDETTFTCIDSVLFKATIPGKSRVGVCRVSIDVTWSRVSWYEAELEPMLAVTVAACMVVTEAAFAVNAILVALAGTVNLAGTPTARLLLGKFTGCPPLAAPLLS